MGHCHVVETEPDFLPQVCSLQLIVALVWEVMRDVLSGLIIVITTFLSCATQ